MAAVQRPGARGRERGQPGHDRPDADDPAGGQARRCRCPARCSAGDRRACGAPGWPGCRPDFRRLLRYGRARGHHAAGRGGRLHARASPPRPRWRTTWGRARERAERGGPARPGRHLPARCCARGSTPGLELPEAAARAAAALPRGARGAGAARRCGAWRATTARTSGASTRSSPRRSSRCFDFLYDRWWRVRVERGRATCRPTGARCWPPTTPGILPWDATMMSVAILREHPLPRYPRFLVLNWAFDLPYVSMAHAQGRRRGGLALQRAAAAGAGRARGRLPRGGEGHRQAVHGALPPAALRPRRLRGAGAAHRRADRAGGGGGQRGDLPEARRVARCSPG